ncbi:MAG: sulfite exporter TauE/SafE family protein [Mariprofundaceae bacterium]|nr:sulfite exporter TauE/SafE family protein [Mariprofundaceae bacterium]
MIDSLPSMLLWMFVMGFMGSLHCVGMCGGLITAISMSAKKTWWFGLFTYQLGRITTYAILGLILGFTGLALHDLGGDIIQRFITILAGSLMIIFALNLGGWLPDPVQRLSSWVTRKTGLMQLANSLAKHARLRGWYALGLVNGLLPCGLVYAALAMGIATGNAIHASLMMASFGLGTIPAMMFVPSILQKMSPVFRLNTLRVAAFFMMVLGAITILRSTMHMHAMV